MIKKKNLFLTFLFVFLTSSKLFANVFISYGDPSGSDSESYSVEIYVDGDLVSDLPPSDFGDLVTYYGYLAPNIEYELHFIHEASTLPEPDLDYFLDVWPTSGYYVNYTQNGDLVGTHYNSTNFVNDKIIIKFEMKKRSQGTGGGGRSGDPVNNFTGALEVEATDLVIPGRGIDFVWSRSHNSLVYYETHAPLGSAWTSTYFQQLREFDNGNDIEYTTGDGRVDIFTYNDGITWDPDPHQYLNLTLDSQNNEFVMTGDGAMKYIFYDFSGFDTDGKLKRIEDRYGNRLQFNYVLGQLDEVLDTYDRSITFSYDAEGRLLEIEDFMGRKVTYAYYVEGEFDGIEGQLKSVEVPDVTGTSTENDFTGLNRKKTTYKYNIGAIDPLLKNNITEIIDPRENQGSQQPYLITQYSTTEDVNNLFYNRVISQTYGDTTDNTFHFHWEVVNQTFGSETATLLLITNNRRGVVKEIFMNDNGNTVAERTYTGYADPNQPTTDVVSGNPPINPMRPGVDPQYFETLYEYDAEGKLTKTTFNPNPGAPALPKGNTITTAYNTLATSRHGEDNPTSIVRADEALGSDPDIAHAITYEDHFELVKTSTDPNSNLTTYFYDYEESELGIDLNGDGQIDTGDRGLLYRINYPEGVVVKYQYNEFGQILKMIDGEGNEVTYSYHPNNDPDGDGITTLGNPDTNPGGYLKEMIVDPTGLALKTQYEYDSVGNVTKITDPRGHVTIFEVNQLNQVVTIQSPQMDLFTEDSSAIYEKAFIYDANDNVKEIWVELENSYDDTDSNVFGFNQPNHYEVIFEYDSMDNVISRNVEAKDYGLETNYQYNPSEFLEKITYPNEDEDFIEYDERDFLFKTTVGYGDTNTAESITQFDYDVNGNLFEVHHPNPAHIDRYTYDGFDRLDTYTDVGINTVVDYDYDSNSNITNTLITGAKKGGGPDITLSDITTSYDGLNRPDQTDFKIIEHETGVLLGTAVYKVKYDLNSLVKSTTNANQHQTILTYDKANRLDTVTDAYGNVLDYIYDSNNNVTKIITTEVLSEGGTSQYTLDYQYDELNRLREVVSLRRNTFLLNFFCRGE